MSNRTWLIAASLMGAALIRENRALAQTYVPSSAADVLEILPKRGVAYVPPELRALHVALAQDPRNLELALKLATGFVAIGREQADPRAYGQAEAALKPWWMDANAPAAVKLLRGTIRQFNHEFGAAIRDLEAYLTENPDDLNARLMKATVHLVTAEYEDALRECSLLQAGRNLVVKATCSATAAGLSGKPDQAYATLSSIAAFMPPHDPATAAWVYGTLGDLALRAGRMPDAIDHFKLALVHLPGDLFAATSLADVLNEQEKYHEVVELMRGRNEQDALLLRLALAEKRLGLPEAKAHVEQLESRFAAEKGRGSAPHGREEAYFRLYLTDEPERAAEIAHANWAVQREPIDARLLLEAAAKARLPKLAEPALIWLKKTAARDPAFVGAMSRIEAM